ncbi:bifunctional GNAT family N-acetyltransferase/acetate--CoA ligase family protein [Actinomadura viridis]|uniref:Acyl-CoA synthetase (NDP forming)/GNAT superfamily N-acetyltransferase n=1 Tax=Actinomadura viridis TaxID=58110 RepID=A0A931DI57_9ACTN|nr:bifunctional GNAT family N-acetyltransferase/acetate--CoA ligase family protein [Actinomadura viridis]MBG6089184.1 acyl-CoA synthetase (NDP forming)/GNAT superfamily N-acetyltransferase [Actinomadura viridis]
MTELASGAPVFALLTDGTQVQIRQPAPEDHDAVRRLHAGLSAESLYLRFFGLNREMAGRIADRICGEDRSGGGALGAWLRGRLVGVAQYEPIGGDGGGEGGPEAEFAMAVAEDMRHRGVGTLLLEHLASLARARGVRAFRADVLAENAAMLRVFADAGLPTRREFAGGVIEATIPLGERGNFLDTDDRYLTAVAARECRAAIASMEPLLRPRAIAVVGAGRRPGTVGAAILRGIRSAGFEGAVYAVNPHAAGGVLGGVPCVAAPADLPEPPDLAVLAVPAAAVAGAAAACGRRGTRAVVVIGSGLTAAQGRALLDACHAHGMRLVGPNCLGVANVPERLDATFAAGHPRPGSAGVVVQSGGVGIALIDHLSRLGIGVSSFASVGDKYDVSGNDMLMWWEADGDTRLGLLHVESFGNPRKFARTARRVAERMPLLTVLAGRSAPGTRAAASHTAAAATPAVTRRALFRQAGIVATDDLGDLVGTAALLAHQPLPAGPRVAIVANAGGGGVLAADACADAGLIVPPLSAPTRERLAALLPSCAAVGNPVDTTAAVTPERFGAALEVIAADASVDAVLVLVAPTALADLRDAVRGGGKPVAAVVLGQAETVTVGGGGVPAYAFPESAVRALAGAWSYAGWRARPRGVHPAFPDARPAEAASIIGGFLAREPGGGWTPPDEAFRLLEAYGVPLAPWRWARSEDEAARAAAGLGGGVALKADVPGVVHKTAAGALLLDLHGEDRVREAFKRLAARFGDDLRGVLVQAMAAQGVEVLCGLVQEEVFGPLVVFGAGGVDTEALADRAARLAPLTDVEAGELIRESRIAPVLLGHPSRPAGDLPGLADLLLRLSRLAADHPQIAELDLNPTIVRADGVVAVDARVRLVPQRAWDPYLRRLR